MWPHSAEVADKQPNESPVVDVEVPLGGLRFSDALFGAFFGALERLYTMTLLKKVPKWIVAN